MSKLPAFTFIEILLAGVIVMVLTGLGVAAMLGFRSSVLVDQASTDLLSALRSTQNMARNSVSSSKIAADMGWASYTKSQLQVDAYALEIRSDNYILHYCLANAGSGKYNCSGVENTNIRTASLQEITLSKSATNCNYIVFERLTGNIVSQVDAVDTYANTGNCSITLNYNGSSTQRVITVDFSQNNFATQ